MDDAQPLIYDTRPLKRAELLPHEEALLAQLQARIKTVLDDVADGATVTGRDEEDAWVVIETRRTPRAVLVDGVRGSGKTSLMLTFLHAVGLAHADDLASRRRGNDQRDGWWSGDPEVLRRCRVLPIADLHPMPEGMPIYAWLMEGFTGAAALADRGRERQSKRGLRGREEHEEEGLKQRLCQLQQSAVVAWNGGSGPKGTSQDEWLLNEKNHISEWAALERRWQRWLDGLLAGLEQAGALPEGGILILPIDDLDLYPKAGQHLLLALRRLHHPRLMFLLTGHHEHLVRGVTEEYLHVRHQRREVGDEERQEAWTLATALVDKVLPSSMRLHVELPTIKDLLTWPAWRAIFEGVPTVGAPVLSDNSLNIDTLEAVIALYVEQLPEVAATTRFLFRPLSQALDRLRGRLGTPTSPASLPFAEVFDALWSALQPELRPQAPTARVTLATRPDPSAPLSRIYANFRLRVYVAKELQALYMIHDDANDIDQTPSPTVLDFLGNDHDAFAAPQPRRRDVPAFQRRAYDGPVRTKLRVDDVVEDMDFCAWDVPVLNSPCMWLWFHRAVTELPTHAEERQKRSVLAVRYLDLLRLLNAARAAQAESDALPFESETDPRRPASRNPDDDDSPTDTRTRLIPPGLITELYGPSLCAPEAGLEPSFAGDLLKRLYYFGNNFPRIGRYLEAATKARIARISAGLPGQSLRVATTIVEAMRSGSPTHPWHRLELMATHGKDCWWLAIEVPDKEGRKQPLAVSLLNRNFRRVKTVPGSMTAVTLQSLFYLPSAGTSIMTAHWVTIGLSTLLQALPEDEATTLIEVARQAAQAPTAAGPALVLRNIYGWLCEIPQRQKLPDAARMALFSVFPGSDAVRVSPDGHGLSLAMAAPPRWSRLGEEVPLAPYFGPLQFRLEGRPWVLNLQEHETIHGLLGAHEEEHPWLKEWLTAASAMIGVLQSYQTDTTGQAFGEIESLPMLTLGEAAPLPFPPLRAWIDHEILYWVMLRAMTLSLVGSNTPFSGLSDRGAISRWLLILWTRVCCDLFKGYRENHLRPTTNSFSVEYPVSDTGIIGYAAESLYKLTDEHAPPEMKEWASSTDRAIRTGLDPEALTAWAAAWAEEEKKRTPPKVK